MYHVHLFYEKYISLKNYCLFLFYFYIFGNVPRAIGPGAVQLEMMKQKQVPDVEGVRLMFTLYRKPNYTNECFCYLCSHDVVQLYFLGQTKQ